MLQPKFSASRFWPVIEQYGVTHISLIPFVIKAAFEQGIPEHHTVRVGVFGLIMPVLDQMLGMRVVAAYGMTELVTHCIHSNPFEQYPDLAMGKVSPGYEFLIVKEDGSVAEVGETGELWIRGIRGVSVFLEYFGNAEATEKFFTEDGWGRTGDMVQLLEDGNIVYRDRDKDALKVGGENVSAREVEDAIRAAGAPLEDVAVVAKQHDMLDMVPVAFAILADPSAEPRRAEHADHRGLPPEPGRLQGAPRRLLRGRVPDRGAGQDLQEGPPGAGRHVPRRLSRRSRARRTTGWWIQWCDGRGGSARRRPAQATPSQ